MTEETELPETQFGLPIDHLLTIDPLDLTTDNLILLITHYRHARFNHLKAMEKPKAVEKNRNPKLDAEASKREIGNMLSEMGFE